jgi:CheY-like chemotaxis protein
MVIEAETSLSDSRAQFVASLGRRLEALRQALFALEQAPKSPALRDHLRRRIHAFGAAAGVLGFDRVFEAFREAEAVLGRTSATSLGPAEFGLVARTVDLVPSLVLGAAAPVARNREVAAAGLDRRGGGWPTSVLVFGGAPLAEPLERAQTADGALIECERAEEGERAEAIVRITAPDVAVIDADRPGARELMETLVYDPLLDPVRIIAVGTFDRPEAAASLVALGVARVLPKPVGPDTLRRCVLEVSRERTAPVERIDPVGDVTIEALGERIAHEVRRGLVDAARAQGRSASIPFGAGTDVLAAVWSSVARIRELATLRSGGVVRFDATGPEGAVPLAPWMGDDRSRHAGSSESRSAEGVSLEGRTIIVVDDDPAVVWFIAGLLRSAGAEVIEAHDGAYALDVARKCWPDVIVSDILMPGLDGFALCREIKRDVALSDVPVILLSWKEDLLQRVRELGADAQGYLRKEATASTVVQRVREVLLPRARIEARLAKGDTSRGRLDGLTPRLVLELVCKKSGDARLTVRDAAYLYEVDVRGGRPRTATRTSADGRFDRGERALSALLGVRAGRFVVAKEDSPCVQLWDAELADLIEGHVERARAAQRALTNPARVAQVEIEEGALEPYLTATPLSAAAVVRRLAEGVPPSDIIATGAPPRLLESVLVDLVLHGAIARIVGFDGEDLLEAELAHLKEKRAAIELPAAKDFRTPGPPSAELMAPKEPPPALPAKEAAPDGAVAEVLVGFDDWEMPADAQSKPGGPDELFAMLRDSMVPAAPSAEDRPESVRHSMKGAAPPTSLPAEPSPLETALRSLPASVSRSWKRDELLGTMLSQPDPRPAEPPRPEPPRPDLHVAAKSAQVALPIAPGVIADVGSTTAVSPVLATPADGGGAAEPLHEPAPISGSDLGAALLAATAAAPVTVPSVAPPPAEPVRAESPHAPAPPVIHTQPAAGEPSVAAPATAKSQETPAARESAASDEAAPGGSAAEGTPAEAQVADGAPGAAAEKSGTPGTGDVELSDAIADAIGVEAARAPAANGAPQKTPVSAAAGGGYVPQRLAPPQTAMRTTPPVSGRAARGSGRARAPKSPAVPPRRSEDSSGVFGTIAIMVIVAGIAFALMTAILSRFRDPQPPSPSAAPSQSAAPVTASSSAATPLAPSGSAAAASSFRALDLDLPPGLTVSEDRGLLEVEADPSLSVYVDGVFIGKGPIRQVPLREGTHEIRLQGGGIDTAQPVQLRHGRRARVEMTGPP